MRKFWSIHLCPRIIWHKGTYFILWIVSPKHCDAFVKFGTWTSCCLVLISRFTTKAEGFQCNWLAHGTISRSVNVMQQLLRDASTVMLRIELTDWLLKNIGFVIMLECPDRLECPDWSSLLNRCYILLVLMPGTSLFACTTRSYSNRTMSLTPMANCLKTLVWS